MPFADTSAGPLHFEIDGDGPDLVLVHELGGAAESFDELIPALRSSHRVLRYDQSGCGRSPSASRALSMADQSMLLAEVMPKAGFHGPCLIAGVAAGAAIAAGLALAQPERVRALALCAPALAVPPERRAYLEERSARALLGGMAAIVEASLARSYPVALRADLQRFQRYRGSFLKTDPVSYAQANQALALLRIEDRLHELRMPCLVLAGRHDLLRPPADVEALSSRIAQSRFAVLDSGHLMPVQAPEEMARQLLDFFSRCDTSTCLRAPANA